MRHEIEDLLSDLVCFCLKMFLCVSIASIFVMVDFGLVVVSMEGGWAAALLCAPLGIVINVARYGCSWFSSTALSTVASVSRTALNSSMSIRYQV